MTELLNQLVELVTEMRTVQKEYFRTRDANALTKARELERAVDRKLVEIEEVKMGDTLF